MSGVDLETVQELLEHGSVTMTMRYSHLAPDHRLRAIQTLDSAYRTDTVTARSERSGESQLVSRAGLEPATLCLKGRCSTH